MMHGQKTIKLYAQFCVQKDVILCLNIIVNAAMDKKSM
jgi:hypothetical protein